MKNLGRARIPLSALTIVLALSLSTYASSKKYDDLPVIPTRPHDYFSLESRTVEIAGPTKIKIHYKVAGKGRPLLLIHGLMNDGYAYRYVISALAEHYQVFVPDLPGAGQTVAPVDFSMTPAAIADSISAFVTALKIEKPYVVGNSLGGYQALWFALLHEEQIRKLVVLHAAGIPHFKIRFLQTATGVPGAHGLYNRLVATFPRKFVISNTHYEDESILSREEVDHNAAIFHDPIQRELFWNVLRKGLNVDLMGELAARLKADPKLAERVPILLLWSKKDALVPPETAYDFQSLLPSAPLIWIDKSSHFLQVDSPERTVEEILAFEAKF